ncbi:carbohydrate ABC transporter substrate-binding protein [Enterococcus saccharolyticus]|uniref:ABC transporter substrate-binding protein n=1 Tax=Enterococcus saccharolyticus TaxID=41997 RepID=UPI001E30AB47|nr:ABC transporter substrate-binding protein [Enterococcus saccharolyticus]MCD5002904.1 carbohydrate ABC transporter substrate-binding protein [Enterococcus saccharolyticus]
MFKKMIRTAAILSAVGLLAACGNSKDKDSTSGNDEDQVTIEILQGKVEFNKQFEALAQQYEELNPGVKINVTSVGGGSDYLSSLKTKFSSGEEPTIFSLSGPSEVDQFRDSVADLSDTEASKKALAGTLDSVTYDDEIVGLPYNLEGYGYIYNKEIFEKAGIDAETIKSYDDLEAAVKTLDSKKDELGIKGVFALPGKETWVMTNHLGNTFLAPEFDNNVLNAYEAKEVKFELSDQYQRALDMQNKYSIGKPLSIDYSQQVEEYFSLGQVAIIQQGNWVYPTIAQIDPEFAKEGIGMLPIPVDGLEGKLPVGVPNYWAVNKNKSDKEVKAAKDFIDWLYLSDEGKKAVVDELNFIPAYEGYDGLDIADPLSQAVYDYSQAGETIGWVFNGYPAGWEQSTFGPEIQKYLEGSTSWDDVIKVSQDGWKEARK